MNAPNFNDTEGQMAFKQAKKLANRDDPFEGNGDWGYDRVIPRKNRKKLKKNRNKIVKASRKRNRRKK